MKTHDEDRLVISDCRPSVIRFAVAMEGRLRANDHKGGWDGCKARYLQTHLEDEVKELREALALPCEKCGTHSGGGKTLEEIAAEAADVGNFAMMIAENFGS